MYQAKFNLTDSLSDFLNNYRAYGFKDKSDMLRRALTDLRDKLERQRLEASANLYAELYEEDTELQELTSAALAEWPE